MAHGDGKLLACKCDVLTRRVIFPTGGSLSKYRDDPSTAVYKQALPESLSGSCQSSEHTTMIYLSALNEHAFINKETLLDIEDDNDQIDDYYEPTPFEDWINDTRDDSNSSTKTSTRTSTQTYDT